MTASQIARMKADPEAHYRAECENPGGTLVTLIAAALIVCASAAAALAGQCPDGRWMDSLEHCKYPPGVQCADGSYRSEIRWCPADEARPQPKPEDHAND